MTNRMVFSAGGVWHRPQALRLGWAESLREHGRFAGDAVMLDYGLPARIAKALAQRGVECLKIDRRPPARRIKLAALADLAGLLGGPFRGSTAAFYDSDVRFLRPIGGLLDAADAAPRCVMAPDLLGYRQAWLAENGLLDRRAYERKADDMLDRLGATINSGMIAGRWDVLAEFLKRVTEVAARLRTGQWHFADQFCVNLLADPDRDRLDAHLYNVVAGDARCRRGLWTSTRPGHAGQPVKALHLTGRATLARPGQQAEEQEPMTKHQ